MISETKFTIKSEYLVPATNGKGATFCLENITSNSQLIDVSGWGIYRIGLKSFKLNKAIYNPNNIELTFSVSTSTDEFADLAIETLLDGKLTVEDKGGAIVEEYLIHDVMPEQMNDYTLITVKAYSPDQMLTYDKYSMAYTAKRLCNDIIPTQLEKTLSGIFSKDMIQIDKLHNTMCNDKEIVYPYLVQYNESFYNFVRRITYRSGEYMYFENGMLHIGLPDVQKAEKINLTNGYSAKQTIGHHNRAGHFASHHYNLNDKGAEHFASDPSYNEECSLEDYAMAIKRDPNTPGKWKTKPETYIKLLTVALTTEGVLFRKSLAVAAATGIYALTDTADADNEEFNKKKKFTESDKGDLADMFDVDSVNAKKFMPYMMPASIGMLMANAYREVRDGEEKTRTRSLHVVISSDVKLGLCDYVCFNNDKKTYVITNIVREGAVAETEKRKNAKGEEEEVIVKEVVNLYTIDIVPVSEEQDACIFPPMQEDIETVRTLGPQTAFVTSTDDPNGLGRVQVLFHWQTKEGDATPLIRLSSQMASAGGGIRFVPNKGDEVIFNFTNGNADLPYVAGALFNADNKAPGKDRSIRSCHGHSIIFDDSGSDDDFVSSMLPITSTLDALVDSSKEDKQELTDAKSQFETIYNKLKEGKNGDKYNDAGFTAYMQKSEKLEYWKEFLKNAIKAEIADKPWTDDELLNRKFAIQSDKDSKNVINFVKVAESDYSNKMYALRAEIRKMEDELHKSEKEKTETENTAKAYARVGDKSKTAVAQKKADEAKEKYDNLKKEVERYQKFFGDAMAISDDEAKGFGKDNDDTKKDKRYKNQADIESTDEEKKSKYKAYLENCDFSSVTTKKNKIDKLQVLIDNIEGKSCEGYLQPDEVTDATDDYRALIACHKAMVAAKSKIKDDDNSFTGRTGGITLTDDSGIYKIAMSASDRAINIASPLGNIKISALTGITISAPNGDVKIEGKNVSIKAGNNLTIDAGNNRKQWDEHKIFKKDDIPDYLSYFADKGTDFGWEVASKTVLKDSKVTKLGNGLIDVGTLRCVMECFLRPVEGTLKIHSQANVLVEAGGSKTSPDQTSLKGSYNQKKVKNNNALRIATGVKYINDTFNQLSTMLLAERKRIKNTAVLITAEFMRINNSGSDSEKDVMAKIKEKFGNTPAEFVAKAKADKVTEFKLEDIVGKEQVEKWKKANKATQYAEKKGSAPGAAIPGATRDAYTEVINGVAQRNKYDKLLKMVNAHVKASLHLEFKNKRDEIEKLSKSKSEYESMGLTSGIMTRLLSFADLVISNMSKTPADGADYMKQEDFRNEKIKLLYPLATQLVDGDSQVKTVLKTFTGIGTPVDRLAVFVEENNFDGTLTPETTATGSTANWEKFIGKFEEAENDTHKIASALNAVASKIDDTILGGVCSSAMSGYNAINELSALGTEAQGNLYLSAKGTGTSRLNKGNILAGTTAVSTKFDDIKAALLENVSNPDPRAAH